MGSRTKLGLRGKPENWSKDIWTVAVILLKLENNSWGNYKYFHDFKSNFSFSRFQAFFIF